MSNTSKNAERLMRLFDQIREAKIGTMAERMHRLALSPSHLRAMFVLMRGPALPMKSIAEQLDITPPSVTALTRRLVETGLVERRADETDSRVTLLSLTDEGRELLHEFYQSHLAKMTRLLEGLSAEEQEQFLGLMERAVLALRASSDADVQLERDERREHAFALKVERREQKLQTKLRRIDQKQRALLTFRRKSEPR